MAPQTPTGSSIASSGEDKHYKDLGEFLKIDVPGPFDGTTGQLQGFLTQLKTYHKFYPVRLQGNREKVLHAGTCLTGAALSWFEPILRDYIEKDKDSRDQETTNIFASFANFEKAIRGAFGNVDEVRIAIQKIQQLKQRGSAADYAAMFRQLSSKTEWDDDPLMSIFYNGLKEEVKDELYKEDTPDSLSDYIAMAVRIDTRQYERRKEKQGKGNGNWKHFQPKRQQKTQANHGRRRQPPSTQYGTHSGPMELDAMRDKSKETCHNCGKKGHYARECRSKKKDWKPVPEGKRSLNTLTNQARTGYDMSGNYDPSHSGLHWTNCVEDACIAHRREKQLNNWYPKKVRSKAGTAPVNPIIMQLNYMTTHNEGGEAFLQQEDPEADSETSSETNSIETEEQEEFLKRCGELMDEAERQWIQLADQRYHPVPDGNAETIYITAVRCAQARGNNDVEWQEDDDPIIQPHHDEHRYISWASCIDHSCSIHFLDKVQQDTFPVRNSTKPIDEPYEKEEVEHFVTQQHDMGIATLRLGKDRPLECIKRPFDLYECEQMFCKVHEKAKLQQWYADNQQRKEKDRIDQRYRTESWNYYRQKKPENKLDEIRRQIIQMEIPCTKCIEEITSYQDLCVVIDKLIHDGYSFLTDDGSTHLVRRRWYSIQKQLKDCDEEEHIAYHNPESEDWGRLRNCKEEHAVNCPGCNEHAIERQEIVDMLNTMNNEGFEFQTRTGKPEHQEWYKRKLTECKWNKQKMHPFQQIEQWASENGDPRMNVFEQILPCKKCAERISFERIYLEVHKLYIGQFNFETWEEHSEGQKDQWDELRKLRCEHRDTTTVDDIPTKSTTLDQAKNGQSQL
jgi:hypothetical protein